MDIISAAKEHFGIAPSVSQHQELAESESECGNDLPLLKQDILEQSGVEVWTCVQAAFKMKSEYTYAESKFAHTWAADSVEHPENIVVPPDTIERAVKLIHQRQDELVIKSWLAE